MPPLRRLLPPLIWALAIAATSSTVIGPKAFVGGASAAAHLPKENFQTLWDHTWWLFVKGWHMAEFALLALLIRRAGARAPLAFALTLAWAILDEWHQSFVPRRGGLATDVLIDAAGAALALLIAEGLKKRKARGKPRG